MSERPPILNKKGQIIDKHIYFTVHADEGPAHGRIHIKTDVTMAQLQHAYNEFSEKKSGQPIKSMLKQVEGRYGQKSGVVRQLGVLMQENDQMRKLASFNKFSKKNGGAEGYQINREEKNWLEINKMEVKIPKEVLSNEKVKKRREHK